MVRFGTYIFLEKYKMKKEIIQLLPFIVLCVMVVICGYTLLQNNFVPSEKHILAYLLVFCNILTYFFNRKLGLIFTGVSLIMASFNLISVTAIHVQHSYFFRIGSMKLSLPYINLISLGVFCLYLIVNHELITEVYRRVSKYF